MYGEQDSSVGTVIRPRAGQTNNRGSMPSRTRASRRVLGSTQFLVQCFQGVIDPGIDLPECEVDSLLAYSAEIKHEWMYNLYSSIHLHAVRRNSITVIVVAYCSRRHCQYNTLSLHCTVK
jgi:hypothetical protein